MNRNDKKMIRKKNNKYLTNIVFYKIYIYNIQW